LDAAKPGVRGLLIKSIRLSVSRHATGSYCLYKYQLALQGAAMLRLMRSLLLIYLALFVFEISAKEMPTVDPVEIVARYGKPDRIVSTEYDKPRPPFVTRTLEYKKEEVRFTLLANAPIGSPPPYTSWKLMGYQDPKTNGVISQIEAEKRLATRKKK